MKCINNWVKITPDKSELLVNGFFVGTIKKEQHGNERIDEYEAKAALCYSGAVEAAPNTLMFHGERIKDLQSIRFQNRSMMERNELHKLHEASVKYDVDCELKKGDRVYFTVAALQHRWFPDGWVRYDECVMRERNGEFYPLNGGLLIQPCEKEKELKFNDTTLLLRHAKVEINKSVVIAKGALVRSYKDVFEHDVDEIQVGDTIWHDATCGFPIEDKDFRKANKHYYYIHRKDILYYENQ